MGSMLTFGKYHGDKFGRGKKGKWRCFAQIRNVSSPTIQHQITVCVLTASSPSESDIEDSRLCFHWVDSSVVSKVNLYGQGHMVQNCGIRQSKFQWQIHCGYKVMMCSLVFCLFYCYYNYWFFLFVLRDGINQRVGWSYM